MAKYAAETYQDPKVVKAACRKAEECQRAVLERFKALVERAQKHDWTVAKTKAALAGRSRNEDEEIPSPLFDQAGKAKTRLTIYLDRVRDPGQATPLARAELVSLLQSVIREIEAVPGQVAAASSQACASAR